jgi:hypothetical protein
VTDLLLTSLTNVMHINATPSRHCKEGSKEEKKKIEREGGGRAFLFLVANGM